MADIIKFDYVIIIVLLIIFIGKNTDGKPFLYHFKFIFFTSNIIFYPILVTCFYSHFSSQQRLYASMIFIVKNISARLVYIQHV